ncbi:hypothetical protein FNV43_RR01928 [Rhamnella rubrinervis]|uniref:Uncharacterized protein n=1 Tax=Rhamnella rubrinervis TaxID=2594499 RepID=A0A8K0HRC6_9ROSA|nr:hypothetical protein FNV43_RR01928 [Rhamnella rubrinervis]
MGQTQSTPKMEVDRSGQKAEDKTQSQPPALHQTDADDDDDNVKQLNECSSLYLALQDCLVNSSRNWKACQMEVQALKSCNERRKKNQGN